MNFAAFLLAGSGALTASPLDLPLGGSDFKLLKDVSGPVDQALSQSQAARNDMAGNPAVDQDTSTVISMGWARSYSQFDGSTQEARWQMPFSRWSLLGRVRYQGFDGLEGRSEKDQITGTYGAYTWALESGVSYLQANRIQIGVLVGGGMEAVSDAKAWAGWGTLGLRYRPQGAAWAVGATASQLGVAGSDRGWVDLPAVLQAGGTYRFDLGRWALIPGADFRWVADEEWVVPVGLEARWEGAALRAGFPIGRPEAAPSFGAGWQSETWGIDLGLGWHWALGLAPSGRISVRL